MRFILIHRPGDPASSGRRSGAADGEGAGVERLVEEMTRAGVLVATGELQPGAQGAIVRRSGRRLTVVDGPSGEEHDRIAGYATVQVASKDEAIRWARRFLEAAGDGESEVRQLVEFADFP